MDIQLPPNQNSYQFNCLVPGVCHKFLSLQFGARRLGEITPDQVATLHYRLRETPIMANQAISLLSRLFHKAAASSDVPPGGNPCRFIKKYPTRNRECFLPEREFERLGAVLRELETAGTVGVRGYAETGKNTMRDRARRLTEKKGWRMTGQAPSASAVQTLGTEAGIESETLQMFLARNAGAAEGRCQRGWSPSSTRK